MSGVKVFGGNWALDSACFSQIHKPTGERCRRAAGLCRGARVISQPNEPHEEGFVSAVTGCSHMMSVVSTVRAWSWRGTNRQPGPVECPATTRHDEADRATDAPLLSYHEKRLICIVESHVSWFDCGAGSCGDWSGPEGPDSRRPCFIRRAWSIPPLHRVGSDFKPGASSLSPTASALLVRKIMGEKRPTMLKEGDHY